jgi:hypothetical protein
MLSLHPPRSTNPSRRVVTRTEAQSGKNCETRGTSVDRDYEKIRIDMQTLFQHLGIQAAA